MQRIEEYGLVLGSYNYNGQGSTYRLDRRALVCVEP